MRRQQGRQQHRKLQIALRPRAQSCSWMWWQQRRRCRWSKDPSRASWTGSATVVEGEPDGEAEEEGVDGIEGGRAGEVELGVVERSVVMANLTLLSGLESRRLYQKVGTLLKSLRQPTLVPEVLGVVDAGDGLVPVGAGGGPAGLGHPHRLAVDGGGDGIEGAVEEMARVLDVVGLTAFVEGVLVDADPVDGIQHSLVAGVAPDVPGVDVADGDIGEGVPETAFL